MQQIDALTLCMDSTNNTFSILKTKPSKSTLFCFLVWKKKFFFRPIVPSLSSSGIWISFIAIRCSLRGYSSKIIWANDHFQIIITINRISRQFKIQSPTWSSPNWSLRTTSYGSHATTRPFAMKTPPLSTRSHSILCHLDLCLPTTFEFFPFTPSPYSTFSCQRPLACWFLSSCHSKFSYTQTSSSPSPISSSLPSSLLES